jgi:hypothetical protein
MLRGGYVENYDVQMLLSINEQIGKWSFLLIQITNEQ